MQNRPTVELPWITCPSCNTEIGDVDLKEKFNQLITEGMSKDDAMTEIGINNSCCRLKFWNVPVIATCKGRELEFDEGETIFTRRNRNTSMKGALFSINSRMTSSLPKTNG